MMSKGIPSLTLAIIRSEYLTNGNLYKLELRTTALHNKSFPPYKIWLVNKVIPTKKTLGKFLVQNHSKNVQNFKKLKELCAKEHVETLPCTATCPNLSLG